MKNEDLQYLRKLLIHVGDEGSSLYTRDLDKLFAFLLPRLEEDEGGFSQQFISIATLQPDKAPIYAAILCRLQLDHPVMVENLLDDIFNCLQYSIKSIHILQIKICLALLGECVCVELLNAFSFIPLLMEILAEIEKKLNDTQFLIHLLLDLLLGMRNFLIQRYSMEYKNLMEDFHQVFNKLDPQRRSFSGRLLAIIGSSDTNTTIGALGKPIRKTFELKLDGFPQIENSMKLFELLCEQEDVSFSLPSFIFAQRLRMLIYAFSSNPQLLTEKIVACGTTLDKGLRNSIVSDILISLCAENIRGAKINSLAIIDKMKILIEGWEEVFNERLTRCEFYLQTCAGELSLNALKLLAFNMAHLHYKNSHINPFSTLEKVSDSFKYYMNCFHMELHILRNDYIPIAIKTENEKPRHSLVLKEVLSVYFDSSLSSFMFDHFISAHALVTYTKQEISHNTLEVFLYTALKSIPHFRAHMNNREPLIRTHLKNCEEYFIEKLFHLAQHTPQRLKFALLFLISNNFLKFEQVVSFCIKKLADEQVGYIKILVDFLEHTNHDSYSSIISTYLGDNSTGYIGQKLLKDLYKNPQKVQQA